MGNANCLFEVISNKSKFSRGLLTLMITLTRRTKLIRLKTHMIRMSYLQYQVFHFIPVSMRFLVHALNSYKAEVLTSNPKQEIDP